MAAAWAGGAVFKIERDPRVTTVGRVQPHLEVKIVDNKTKEDLTTVTLAQIIFEEEKKQRSFMPLGAMRNIIQNGGEWFAEAQRRVTSVLPFKRGEDEPPPEAEPEDDAGDEGAPRPPPS